MAAGLNRTTIAAPISAADTLVTFTSGSGLFKGYVAYIDREAMVLQAQPIPARIAMGSWRRRLQPTPGIAQQSPS
jgi:hypothetical protein